MLQIGSLTFASPFVLAPLAGFTDLAFRLLCRQFGAGFCVSEMASCHGIVYRQNNTQRILNSTTEERPVSLQLFGADPETMATAAEMMESYQADMIDINMGCPVKKVTKKGAGAALMTRPKLAQSILQKIVSRVTVPVTVKIRSGKDSHCINAPDFAKMAEDAGVSGITVHARTWSQGFSGQIDRGVIGAVKMAVSLPVIGNGDVFSFQDGCRLMDDTGCDGVMIGRGALGNPWIFQETGRPKDLQKIIDGAELHLLLIEKYLPVERLLGPIKNHMCRYFKELPESSMRRQNIFAAPNFKALREQIASYR